MNITRRELVIFAEQVGFSEISEDYAEWVLRNVDAKDINVGSMRRHLRTFLVKNATSRQKRRANKNEVMMSELVRQIIPLDTVIRKATHDALIICNFNRTYAAAGLGISIRTLRLYIKRFGLKGLV